jgi:(2Fe-2S) ferredoxin
MGWEDEVHYGQMTPEGIRTVLDEHVGHDRPVEALRGPRED